MSKIALSGNASGTGVLTIAVPNTNSDRTLTLPDESGTVLTSASNVAFTNATQSFTAAQRGTISALTDGATITPDFAAANNYSVTLGGNRTLANPSNLVAGQSGSIFISQDGTGGRTLAWGSYWDFANGTAPTLTTTASAVDRVDYVVRSSTSIQAVWTGNYS